MKANLRQRLGAAVATATLLSLISSCSAPPVEPTPAPTPTPVLPPPPRPAPVPDVHWREAPITPGDWSWSMIGGQSVATFAGGTLVLRCNHAQGTVTMQRSGNASGQVPMTVITSQTSRQLSGSAQGGPIPAITVTFQARDPLLDAMAFSRGRFAVETAGLPTLYVPSWPEVSRVIEDCR